MNAPINIDELERLALAATQGEWRTVCGGRGVQMSKIGGFTLNTGSCPEENAAYIAAANPATMLQLIAIIREKLAADGDEPEEENGK